VNQLQALVHAATGVSGRLLRRDDATETWMEVYEGVADAVAFEAALSHAVSSVKLNTLLADGAQRHTERFADA
jgi:hypothetical protein